MDIWFTSDWHFGHKNIINYSNRPFRDTGEMDEVLIERFNNRVHENDLVFNLGDVFFCKTARMREIMSRLNGRKILIRGNHDEGIGNVKFNKLGFDVFNYYQFEDLFLSHHPQDIRAFKEAQSNTMLKTNLCGHTHEDTSELNHDVHFNVCLENTNYEPLHLDFIRQCINNNTRPYL